MAFSINTNEAALIALRTLGKATQNLTATSQRVSTGQRVSSPAEDGAVFAIGKKTASDVAAWGAVRERQVFGKTVIDSSLGYATEVSDILKDLKADAASLSGPLSNDQKKYIYDQMKDRFDRIDQVASGPGFNGVNLLSKKDPPVQKVPVPNSSPPSFYPSDINDHQSRTAYNGTTVNQYTINNLQGHTGNIQLDYDSTGSQTRFEVIQDSAWNVSTSNTTGPVLLDTGFTSGPGQLTVPIPQMAGSVTVKVSVGPPSGPVVNFGLADWNYGFHVNYNGNVAAPPSPPPASQAESGSFSVIKDIDGNDFRVEYRLMTSDGLGLNPFTFEPISDGLKQIDKAISSAGDNINYWSGKSRLIDGTMRFGDAMTDALQMANGAILDADMAAESAKLEAEKIKQQLAAQTLSITNNAPQLLLGLFRQ